MHTREMFASKSALSWGNPVPSSHQELPGNQGSQFEAPIPPTPQTLDMIVLQLERFGIRLTPEQKMLQEHIGRRTADSLPHPAPMSPTLGDSSFLAPNLKHMASPFDIPPKSFSIRISKVYL
jgi:hypothetical protein